MTIQSALTSSASSAMRSPFSTMYLDIYHDKISFIFKLIARNLGLFICLFVYLFICLNIIMRIQINGKIKTQNNSSYIGNAL